MIRERGEKGRSASTPFIGWFVLYMADMWLFQAGMFLGMVIICYANRLHGLTRSSKDGGKRSGGKSLTVF